MKSILRTLLLFTTAASCADECKPNRFGDLPSHCDPSDAIPAGEEDETKEWWEDESNFLTAEEVDALVEAGAEPVEREPGRWMIVLIKADGEFVDFQELGDHFPNIDLNYQTRVECLEDGIYRMQTSLDLMDKMHRNDDGSIGMTYTQYLGFLCEEVEETGK